MDKDDENVLKNAIREAVAPVILEIALWDANPLRDAHLIADAALKAVESAGFIVIRDG